MAHVGLDAGHRPIGRPQKLAEMKNVPIPTFIRKDWCLMFGAWSSLSD